MMIVLICIQSKAWFFDLLCISKNQIEEHCKSAWMRSSCLETDPLSAVKAVQKLAEKAMMQPYLSN